MMWLFQKGFKGIREMEHAKKTEETDSGLSN